MSSAVAASSPIGLNDIRFVVITLWSFQDHSRGALTLGAAGTAMDEATSTVPSATAPLLGAEATAPYCLWQRVARCSQSGM